MPFEFGKPTSGGKRLQTRPTAPDPLAGVDYTGNVETDAATELAAIESAFIDRRNTEDARFKNATDSEYWFAVCFKTRAHKDAFLEAVNAVRLGDKYLDGHALARLLGVPLPD